MGNQDEPLERGWREVVAYAVGERGFPLHEIQESQMKGEA